MIVFPLWSCGFSDGPSASQLGDALARNDTETTQIVGTNLVVIKYGHQQHGSINVHTLWPCYWTIERYRELYLIHKYKNEVGCRDDTVPKTVDTRRHARVRACNNLPQPKM